MLWNTVQLFIVALAALVVGVILGFLFGNWWFRRQLKEIEKNYQKSVRKTYQEMGSFFGRKMKEEDLNRITAQIGGETEKKKIKPKKTQTKKGK